MSEKLAISENIYLKILEDLDLTEAYFLAMTDQTIYDLTEARHQEWTEKKVRDYVRKAQRPGESRLIGIFKNIDNKHIGNIRLSGFSEIHKRVDLGILIFDKSEWGKGFGTESIDCAVSYVFDTLGFHRICADYYALNAGSERMFEKAGFVKEGIFRDHFFYNDRYVDSVRICKLNIKRG